MDRSKGKDLLNILGVEGGEGEGGVFFFFGRLFAFLAGVLGIHSSIFPKTVLSIFEELMDTISLSIILWHVSLERKDNKRCLSIWLSMDHRIWFKVAFA